MLRIDYSSHNSMHRQRGYREPAPLAGSRHDGIHRSLIVHCIHQDAEHTLKEINHTWGEIQKIHKLCDFEYQQAAALKNQTRDEYIAANQCV